LDAFVELDAEIRGTEISASKNVFDEVVAPAADPTAVLTVDKYTLNVVATEFVAAADATTLNLTLWINDPLVPDAKAEYIKSVPVPALVPSDFTCADVVPIFTCPTLGVKLKIGEVFAGIITFF
jgi:hypothetical protein